MLFNPEALAAMLYEMPDQAGTSVAYLAKRLGKPASTLGRELNPDDAGAKLGLETFVFLSAETGDFAPLDYIETALGRVAFALPPVAGSSSLHRTLGEAGKEFGELVNQLMTDLADGSLDDVDQALKEIADVARVLATLRALVLAEAKK